MKRVLVFIEGWGCRKKGRREYCRVVVKDRQGEDVIIKFWRNYNKGNKVLPVDDDRANAIAVLVEYLRGGYTHGIAIVSHSVDNQLLGGFSNLPNPSKAPLVFLTDLGDG